MGNHARLGPSNHRWVHCPGSIREEAIYPDFSSSAAADGTGSHLLLEKCLDNNVLADAYDTEVIGSGHEDSPMGWFVDKDRIDRVNQCLNYVLSRTKELKEKYKNCQVTVKSEMKVNPGFVFGRTDWWGTCDITILVSQGVHKIVYLEVIDYKDGKLWVEVENNSQLQGYAIGVLGDLLEKYCDGTLININPKRLGESFPEEIRMTIVQPKTSVSVRYEDISMPDLIRVAHFLNEAAVKTDAPQAPLIPDGKNGKGYCRWCKHKDNCEQFKKENLKGLDAMFQQDDLPKESGSLFDILLAPVSKVKELDNNKLAELADAKAAVLGIFESVDKEIEQRVKGGENIPGYGLVPGRKTRVWNCDEEKIAKVLKSRGFKNADIYPPKLLTPAQALKSDKLTDKQKEKLESDYIADKFGSEKIGRVNKKQKPSIKSMFDGLPDLPEKKEEVTFL